uniref:Exopolysaccharide biosynthesis polyprenyl glycosylphosphotransferase n=1 Tax=candidate division WOR-3 bacterium TaxID=2052148 RepID=A0A7V3ZZP6_UNCW3
MVGLKRGTTRTISKIILVLIDLFLIAFSFYVAYYIRVNLIGSTKYTLPPALPIAHYSKYFFALFIIWIATFYYEGLYTKYFTISEELLKIAKGATIAAAFSALLLYTIKVEPSFSRLAFIIAYILSIFLIWIGRIVVKGILYEVGLQRDKALFWGDSVELEWFKRTIEKEKNSGIEVIGHIKNGPAEKVKQIISEKEPDLLIVGGVPLVEVKKVENLAWEKGVEILINAFNHALNPLELEIVEFFGFKSLRLKYNLLIPRNAKLKRLLDLLVTIPLLIIFLPVISLISVVILATSKGPVIFTQARLGKDGKLIKIYKFRTMYSNSDEILQEFFKEHPEMREEFEKYRKIVSMKDPRVTPIGKILRKTSLDELPQLFNVLKGDMSLVGPRPYLPEELTIIEDVKDIIFSVKPGLTGLWQVSGRNTLTFEERIMLDLYYVKNWNIFLDLAIFIKTVLEIFKGEGAY